MMVMIWSMDRYGKLEAIWRRDYGNVIRFHSKYQKHAMNAARPTYVDEYCLMHQRAKQLSALFREALLEGEEGDVSHHRRIRWQ